jgi:hypothetical protein
MRAHLVLLIAAALAACARPAAGKIFGFDFQSMPCRYTGATTLPDFSRPCDTPPRNATTGDFYNFQVSADETEACCSWTSGTWYWIKVDKNSAFNDALGSVLPIRGPTPAPTGEAASDLPSSVPAGASDPFNEDGGKPPAGVTVSAAGQTRSLVAAAGLAVAVATVLL